MSKPTDLLQGTLDLLILKVIGLEPMHGWAIAQRIRLMSGDVLQVGQGALYPSSPQTGTKRLDHRRRMGSPKREDNRKAKCITR